MVGMIFCFYVFMSDVGRLGVDSFAATQLLSGGAIDQPKLRTATLALHGPTTLSAAMQRVGGAAASHWPLLVGGLATYGRRAAKE